MRFFRHSPVPAIVLGLLVGAGPLLADAGVPMLAVVWPISWLLLLPIVIAEALVARGDRVRVVAREGRVLTVVPSSGPTPPQER